MISSKPSLRASASGSFLAMACIGFIASAPAAAQSADAASGEKKLGGMTVTATAIEEEVKVEKVESPKATRLILDTPQTITVIGDQVIRKQNLLTLRDALQTIPGITFGAGEGGGGYGDSINLRGYSANNDITQDGVRDSAQYSRSETFNLQQIEVYNGANSVFGGGGAVGGTINLVTKTPQADDLTIVQGGVGTAGYYRGTVDSNIRASEQVAARLNAVYHKNHIPGRRVEKNERWGIAPSLTYGIEGPTSVTLQYLHQTDDNVPVYGVPYYQNLVNDGPLPGIDPKDRNYYGIENLDDQDIRVDQATLRINHEFSDKLSIRNLSRWQRVKQNSSTSAPQGTYCLANGFQPIQATTISATAAACPTGMNTPGFYYPSGPRGNIRNQLNKLLYNQTDLHAVFDTGGLEHTLVVGISFTDEKYELVSGNILRTATGATAPQPPLSLTTNNTIYTGPINFIQAGFSRGDTSNVAGYLFDTVKIVPHLEFNLGLRYEKAKGKFRADTFNVTPGPSLGVVTTGLVQRSSESLLSYRFGLNYKPIETVSIYAAYGNSRTPTSATVRLGCGVLIGGNDPCDVKPEKAVNYEVGVKADVFERRLQLTAALFRNERANFRVATNDPIVTTLPVNDGRSRVDGLALGATGNVTENWAVFANYTYLKGKVLQSVSNFCLANPGPRTGAATNVCANSAAIPDPQAGNRLINTPRHSGSLFTTYQFPIGLQVGYGLTYTGSFTLNQSALASGTALPVVDALTPVFRSKSWLTHRLFASYEVMTGLTAQVNIQNLTNKRYFTGIRNNPTNGWATPGDTRSAVFSLYYSF